MPTILVYRSLSCLLHDKKWLRPVKTSNVPLVVILPGALESESKTAPQDIRISDSIVRYANRRLLLAVEDFGILAFSRIEIEVGFHAACKHMGDHRDHHML